MVIYIIPAVIALLIGGGLLLWGNRTPDLQVNPREFGIGIGASLLVTVLVGHFGQNLAVTNAVEGYKEFWNGSIVTAQSKQVNCERDGDCTHTYRCDRYYVDVLKSRQVPDGTDADGNTKYKTEYYTEQEERWHSCPYSTEEYSYWLVDSFDRKHPVWSDVFSANPKEWRAGEGIPENVQRGEPPQWVRVKQLIAEGNAPPATKTAEYTNYVLASTNTILKRYSADVEKYQKDGLLPPHTANWKDPMLGPYTAHKVVFVKTDPQNQQEWQDSLSRLNAALGTERQGDMHIAVVSADAVGQPDVYINALMAYWQSPEFGKWALGKNSIAVVVGLSTDGSRVEWVRAKTGMPTGNGEMLAALSLIKDIPSSPASVVGNTRASIKGDKPVFDYGNGAIENVVLSENPFMRACMECTDKDDNGTSYTYLKKDVKITGSAKIGIAVFSLFVIAGIWLALWFMPWFEPFERVNTPRTSLYRQTRRYTNW